MPGVGDDDEPRQPAWPTRVLTLGWAGLAAVPLTSGWSAVRSHWTPVVDNGLIAAQAVDSVSGSAPLLGMPSSLGPYTGAAVRHPGPLGFWLLALPAEALGAPGYGLVVGAVVTSVACLAGLAFLVRRTCPPVLEAVALVTVALAVLGLGGDRLRDPFNPYMGVLPLLLHLAAAAAVLAGRHRWLPVAVVAGSLSAQLHVSNLVLVGGVVVALVVVVGRDLARSGPDERSAIVRWSVAPAAVLGLLAWSGPIVDQVRGNGNLVNLLRAGRSGDQATAGWGIARDRLVDMVAPVPGWASGRVPNAVGLAEPGAARAVIAAAWLALLVATLVRALGRRRRPLAAMTGVALWAVAASTWMTARMPTGLGQETFFPYMLVWWPTGVMVAVAGAWAIVDLVPAGSGAPARWKATAGRAAVPLGVAASLVAALAAHHPLDPATEPLSQLFDSTRHHAQAVVDLPEVRAGAAVVIEMGPPQGDDPVGPDLILYGHVQGLIGQLRLEGVEVRFVPDERPNDVVLYDYRDRHPATGVDEVAVLVRVSEGVSEDDAPSGYRRVSHHDPQRPSAAFEGYDHPFLFAAESAVFVRESSRDTPGADDGP